MAIVNNAAALQEWTLGAHMTIMTIMTIKTNKAQRWTIAEAKAKFSEVIHKASSEGPQTVTRNGRTAAVIVSPDEWEKKTKRKGNLAQFFAASPLRGSGVEIKRIAGKMRGPL